LLLAELSPLSLQEKLPYFNKLQMAYHGPTGLSTSNAAAQPQNPSCELGLQAVALDARYCLPCPAGYAGDATSLSNCSMCELGYYQPIEGQVSCAKCPTDMHMTGIRGASHADDCSIPKPEFRPTLPVGCTPPSCTDSPTQADVYWTMESIDAPDGEEKTVSMAIFMQFSWHDPRLVLDPHFERDFRENAITLNADGTARTATVTITTAEWRRRNFWLPPYRVPSSVSGLEGELSEIDDDIDQSNVTISLSPYEDGEKLWRQQRSIVHVVWSRSLENAVVEWDELNWHMFPFGRQPLTVELMCREEVLCEERSNAANGKYKTHPPPQIESDPTMPLEPGSLSMSSSFSTSVTPESNLSTSLSSTPASRSMRIQLVLVRDSDLTVVRLIVPTILTMLLGVFVFFVQDSTWTVDMCFAVLLVLTVIAVEVKDDFPGHVTYRSWMDYFIFMNTIVIVICVGLGILVIILSEREDTRCVRLSACIDSALSITEPIISIFGNLIFLSYGSSNTTFGKEGIDTIERMFKALIISNCIAIPTLTAFFYYSDPLKGIHRMANGVDRVALKHAKRTRSLVLGAVRRLAGRPVQAPQTEVKVEIPGEALSGYSQAAASQDISVMSNMS